jgi:hypothetical protein
MYLVVYLLREIGKVSPKGPFSQFFKTNSFHNEIPDRLETNG